MTPEKPLGIKAYGSIGHLPSSRLGPGDHKVPDGMARICLEKVRDRHDEVIVQEKLDGSCCAVAKRDGKILALGRAGYLAQTSRFEQHQLFAEWVRKQEPRFDLILDEGERLVGEWLAQAHGTRYTLGPTQPFVPFDLMIGAGVRYPFDVLKARLQDFGLEAPALLHRGGAISLKEALKLLGPQGHHGALDPVEGLIYRVQRKHQVDFLAKWVRPDKVDGCYLPDMSSQPAIWNWRPDLRSTKEPKL